MKINFDIECTPEEARTFLGLPDVVPMQERMIEVLEERMLDNVRSLDPETFMKTWMPTTVQGWTDVQKMFWTQMGVNTSDDAKPSAKKQKS